MRTLPAPLTPTLLPALMPLSRVYLVCSALAAGLMLAGASPRGMSQLLRAARVAAWLDGRLHVTPEDLRSVFAPVIAHRLCLQPVHELRRGDIVPLLIDELMARVPVP